MPAYSAPVGAPIWFDLASSDVDRAADFYNSLFGWTVDDSTAEFGGYRQFFKDGRRVAGLGEAMAGQPSDVWTVYFHTDDISTSTAKIDSAGGQIFVSPMGIGDLGAMAVATDPAGAAFGLWEPDTHHGFETRGEPGTPYWFDEMSTDYDASLAFYPQVFDCETVEVTEGADDTRRYSQIVYRPGTDGSAGLMDAKGMFDDGHPSFWQVYITVEDTAATLDLAVDLGGSQLGAAEDTPFGVLASFKDPMGAAICIATPPAGM